MLIIKVVLMIAIPLASIGIYVWLYSNAKYEVDGKINDLKVEGYGDDVTPEEHILTMFELQENFNKKFKRIGIVFVILNLGLLYVIAGFTYVAPSDNLLTVNRFSGESTFDNKPGVKFVEPISNSIFTVNIKENVIDYEDTGNTKDNIQTTFVAKLNYKIVDIEKYYDKRFNVSDENIQALILSEMTKAMDTTTNMHDYEYIKSNVAKIGTELSENGNVYLSSYGIDIVSINIMSLEVPKEIDAAIQDKVVKQQQADASKYAVEKAQNESEALKIKQNSVDQAQQQKELCQKAIDKGQSNSPSCYFGDGTYVNGASGVNVQ